MPGAESDLKPDRTRVARTLTARVQADSPLANAIIPPNAL